MPREEWNTITAQVEETVVPQANEPQLNDTDDTEADEQSADEEPEEEEETEVAIHSVNKFQLSDFLQGGN